MAKRQRLRGALSTPSARPGSIRGYNAAVAPKAVSYCIHPGRIVEPKPKRIGAFEHLSPAGWRWGRACSREKPIFC
jgi:hypothetical protein